MKHLHHGQVHEFQQTLKSLSTNYRQKVDYELVPNTLGLIYQSFEEGAYNNIHVSSQHMGNQILPKRHTVLFLRLSYGLK